jgi:hypothetical protein
VFSGQANCFSPDQGITPFLRNSPALSLMLDHVNLIYINRLYPVKCPFYSSLYFPTYQLSSHTGSFPLGFSYQNPLFWYLPCLFHFIHRHLVALTIFGDDYKIKSPQLYNFLRPPITSPPFQATSSSYKICKSVDHRTIQIDHQPDATIFQFIILTFIYSSTCFGRSPAHLQELNDCSSSLWFNLRIVVIAVLCSWSGLLWEIGVCQWESIDLWSCDVQGTSHDHRPEAATAVIELLKMSGKTPETCWAENKHQDNKLENFCIWSVVYLYHHHCRIAVHIN